MKDEGVVIYAGNKLAEVEVSCLDACQDCSARNICGSSGDKKGSLKVLNPVGAVSGDKVSLEIPESAYNRKLIWLFGGLLTGATAGAFLGYFFPPGILSPDITAPLGLFLGGGIAGWILFNRIRRGSEKLYPVITGIIPRKGETNG